MSTRTPATETARCSTASTARAHEYRASYSSRAASTSRAQAARAAKPDPLRIFDLDTAFHRAYVEGAAGARLLALHDAMFMETSPGPVKFAASLLGHGSEFCRLPLAPVQEGTRTRVRTAMLDAGLLN